IPPSLRVTIPNSYEFAAGVWTLFHTGRVPDRRIRRGGSRVLDGAGTRQGPSARPRFSGHSNRRLWRGTPDVGSSDRETRPGVDARQALLDLFRWCSPDRRGPQLYFSGWDSLSGDASGNHVLLLRGDDGPPEYHRRAA